MLYFGSAVLLDEAARTDITRTLTLATFVQSTSGEPVSRKRTRNVGPAASSNNTAEPKYDMLVSSMTYIAHNSFVFYSCI